MDEKILISLPRDFEVSTGNSHNSNSTSIICSTFEDEEEWTDDDWGEDPMEEEWEDDELEEKKVWEEEKDDDDEEEDDWDEDWDDDDWDIDIDENSSH